MWIWLAVMLSFGAWVPTEQYHTEHFTFLYSPEARSDALAIAAGAERTRLRIVVDLGKAPPSPTVVVVVATRKEFDRAQPGRPLPRWVAGVAYPRKNLVILGPAPPEGRAADRHVLFAHEYSHVALAHATRFRGLPRWFVEGFADLQAMAPFVGDWRGWGARGALPIRELHQSLGHDHQRASQSYQQSYDLVRFLRGRGDAVSFRRFIRQLAQGVPFDTALREIYQVSPGELESAWRRKWNFEQVLVPMMTSGLFLWVIAAILLVLGYIRKRRERLAAIAAMEGYDDEEDDGDDGDFDDGRDDGDREGVLRGARVGRAPPGEAPSAHFPERAGGEVDAGLEPVASPRLLIGAGALLIGTVISILLTGLLTLIWPSTRLWLLAGPAVVLTFLALRLMFGRD